MADRLGFIGGTGPQGRGLAARFAMAGHPVVLGSRDAARGAQAAEELAAELVDAIGADAAARIGGGGNDDAAAADVVFVVVPYEAQAATLEPLAGALDGRLVVNCVNHMAFDARGPYAPDVPAGSAAEECAELLPGARVVSAFHDISARKLITVGEPMDSDVLVCGDDPDANATVIELAAGVANFRGVDCGPLRLSAYIEHLTPVLVSINKRYKTHASVRITGI